MATVSANKKNNYAFFEHFSNNIISWVGSSAAFLMAGIIVIMWAILGPVMHYSDVWQLIINTITSIATFLMVFIIQKSQNKDSKAIQLKLDELIAANRFASNRMVNIEDLTEEKLDELRRFYTKLSKEAAKNVTTKESISIDAAEKLQNKNIGSATAKRQNRNHNWSGRNNNRKGTDK